MEGILHAGRLNLGSNTQNISRGRPFDSEGGGGLALFGNKYSDLENAGNK